jgi:hypothetical protein
MSHIVQIETKMYDPQVISTACHRLGLKGPVEGTAQLFSGSVTGLLAWIPTDGFRLNVRTRSARQLPRNTNVAVIGGLD